MQVLIPIVGLRHYVADVEAFLASLLPDREVLLVFENGNLRDRTAIQAWVDGVLVGYVSSDFTCLIRYNYPDVMAISTAVMNKAYSDGLSAFYVGLDLDTLSFPFPSQVKRSPIHDIALPDVNMPKIMALLDIDSRIDDLYPFFDGTHVTVEVVERLISVVRDFSEWFGHSLSGTERYMCLKLSGVVDSALTYLTPNMEELYIAFLDLLDKRRDFASDSTKAAAVMQAELDAIRPQLVNLFAELDALIRSGMVERAMLLQEVESWLHRLPNNLYAYIDQPAELAIRLHYLRLSSEELYAVYIYMLLRAYLKRMRKAKAKGEPILDDGFPFWATDDAAVRAAAVDSMRHAVLGNHRYGKYLADEVSRLIRKRVLRPIANKRVFVSALDRLLDLEDRKLKYPTLVNYLP